MVPEIGEKIKRCFVSLDLSREAINEIIRIQLLLKEKNFFVGKFTEPDNLHLTLKFLGEIDENKVNEVDNKLREIAFESFKARLGNLGIFSGNDKMIIWVELNKILELQKVVDGALKDIFKPESRFMSHVTIARVKLIADKKKFMGNLKNIKLNKVDFKIDRFYLMESKLNFQGPVYSVIKKYNLKS